MQYLITESDKVFEGEHFTGNIGAEMIHPDGKPYRTFRTQTVLAEGHRLTFKNCTFENTAGPGKLVGQAIALYLKHRLKSISHTCWLIPAPKSPCGTRR